MISEIERELWTKFLLLFASLNAFLRRSCPARFGLPFGGLSIRGQRRSGCCDQIEDRDVFGVDPVLPQAPAYTSKSFSETIARLGSIAANCADTVFAMFVVVELRETHSDKFIGREFRPEIVRERFALTKFDAAKRQEVTANFEFLAILLLQNSKVKPPGLRGTGSASITIKVSGVDFGTPRRGGAGDLQRV